MKTVLCDLAMNFPKKHGLYCSSLPYTYAVEENPKQTCAIKTLYQCHNALEPQQVHVVDLVTCFSCKY